MSTELFEIGFKSRAKRVHFGLSEVWSSAQQRQAISLIELCELDVMDAFIYIEN